MIRTRVGYTGGTRDDPSYHKLGNHTEALQVDCDPDKLSYEDLLKEVFKRHDPFNNIGHTQYMNGLWYEDDPQQEVLNDFLQRNYDASIRDEAIETQIEPAGPFFRAEDYHQKYYLRKHNQYMEYFGDHSPKEFADSTLAARLNGILAGKATSLEPYDSLAELDLPRRLDRDLHSRVS